MKIHRAIGVILISLSLASGRAEGAEDAPKPAEDYIESANAWFKKARESGVQIQAGSALQDFTLIDRVTGEPAGVIATGLDQEAMTQAIASLETGLKHYPERLDLWLGQAYLLEQAGRFEEEYRLLKDLCRKAKNSQTKWVGKDNEPSDEDPNDAIPEAIHARTIFYLNQEDPVAADRAMKLAQLSAEYFPNLPYAFNSIAALYSYQDKWPKVLEYLEKAHKVAPADTLILLNLAETKVKLGRPEEARKNYEEVIALDPNSEHGDFAREGLEELRKSSPSS